MAAAATPHRPPAGTTWRASAKDVDAEQPLGTEFEVLLGRGDQLLSGAPVAMTVHLDVGVDVDGVDTSEFHSLPVLFGLCGGRCPTL